MLFFIKIGLIFTNRKLNPSFYCFAFIYENGTSQVDYMIDQSFILEYRMNKVVMKPVIKKQDSILF